MFCDNLKLEKSMYNVSNKSFTEVLEELDPSENYKNTSFENLDAYQRQLKRFDMLQLVICKKFHLKHV